MSNPFFNATSYLNYSVGDGYVFAQLDGSSGTISFNQSYDVYFTVVGGGGGGGGGGHNNGGVVSVPQYPSGGGGGAGAAGMVLYKSEPGKIYNYTIGAGGDGGVANLMGENGEDTSILFSPTDSVISRSGSGGTGHYNGNIGGIGGAMEISGNITPIVDGVGGNGGNGVKYDKIPNTGTEGYDSNPPIITISPTNTIYVGGGGGGADASNTDISPPPPKPSNGGGGGNGSGGFLGTGETDGSGNGQVGIAYGAGGGGGGQPGDGSPVVFFPITYGGNGKEGAIFIYLVNLTNGCQWNPLLANKTTLWTRATTDCIDLTDATLPDGEPLTRDDLSEKRKATIFQYKQNGAGFSKKQNYSRLARGLGRQRGQSFATQNDTYTNANTHNLPIVNNRILSCPNVTKNWALTNQNDTPGPVRRITNYPTVPLTNYIVRRTYPAGGGKWPQYGWAPGNMGFPVGKKGNK